MSDNIEQAEERERSNDFKREESVPPTISEEVWNYIKSTDKRKSGEVRSRDSSSKRSRQNPRSSRDSEDVVIGGRKEFSSRTPRSQDEKSSQGSTINRKNAMGFRVKKKFDTKVKNNDSSSSTMRAPPLPLMLESRKFTNPPGLVQSDKRNEELEKSRIVKSEGDDRYFRKNLRLNDDSQKRALRGKSEELWLQLFRRQPEDPMDPLAAFTEEEVAFARMPFRFRILAETGDRARVKILARDELRTIRYKSGNPNDESFYKEFDEAVEQYRNWHLNMKKCGGRKKGR